MNAQRLIDTAKALMAGDKGLLAMDEGTPELASDKQRMGVHVSGWPTKIVAWALFTVITCANLTLISG